MTDDLRKQSTILELIGMLEYELEAIDQTFDSKLHPDEKLQDTLEYLAEARATLRALRDKVGLPPGAKAPGA
jgi:hypothetical protein